LFGVARTTAVVSSTHTQNSDQQQALEEACRLKIERAIRSGKPPRRRKGHMTSKEIPPVLTIGHSTHSLDEFVNLLTAHEVDCVVDVRTVPRSRRNPQFNRESLPETLASAGIEYVHLSELGGLRRARPDSINTGWENASFRGYADYMGTPEFAAALDRLLGLAAGRRVSLMCAEAVPWRCHRSLIADALLVRGVPVAHIMSRTTLRPHALRSFARVQGPDITYPAVQPDDVKRGDDDPAG
jgi:hypothetical protein